MKVKACKRCAQRKIKCDKQIPCSNCIRFGVSRTCIANNQSFQASSLLTAATPTETLQLQKKEKNSRRIVCDRCVERKVFCDKKYPCSTCERLQVRCHFSEGIHHQRQESIISPCNKYFDKVEKLLPPSNVFEEIFQVIHQGDFIWHWPCIDSSRILSILKRLKDDRDHVTITEMAFLFCFLAATSSLLPAAHSCRIKNKQFISKESNIRYKKAALDLLEQDNRYAFASDDSTPLLECWAYHLLWWDSMIKVDYKETIRFCEQSLISAGIVDLFGTAFNEARQICATTSTLQSTIDPSRMSIVILALDLLFSNSRIRFLLPGCIAGTQLESFVHIAMSSLRLCTFFPPAERALYIIRAELTIWLNRTDDVIGKLFDGNRSISEEILSASLSHIQWIEWRSACIITEFPEFFGYQIDANKIDDKFQQSSSPADITFLQRNFCLRTNALALQCGILRILLASLDNIEDNFLIKAFVKGRSLLVEIVKSWAAIIRLDWLHPTLRFSAVPFVEVSLSILYQVMQKVDINEIFTDNTTSTISPSNQSQKQEKFQCLLWIKDNFSVIYDFLTDVGISCPSSMNLNIAFNSIKLSSSSIVRLDPSLLELYLKILCSRNNFKEQERLIWQEEVHSSQEHAEISEI